MSNTYLVHIPGSVVPWVPWPRDGIRLLQLVNASHVEQRRRITRGSNAPREYLHFGQTTSAGCLFVSDIICVMHIHCFKFFVASYIKRVAIKIIPFGNVKQTDDNYFWWIWFYSKPLLFLISNLNNARDSCVNNLIICIICFLRV